MIAQVEIRADANGRGQVIVNGHDLTCCVIGVELSVQPGHVPVLRLKLKANSLITIDTDTRAWLTPEVQEALQVLGWTPPPSLTGVLPEARNADAEQDQTDPVAGAR